MPVSAPYSLHPRAQRGSFVKDRAWMDFPSTDFCGSPCSSVSPHIHGDQRITVEGYYDLCSHTHHKKGAL
eukprot:scaffold2366_cov159-Amphora_coffeaeformis.AAC.6